MHETTEGGIAGLHSNRTVASRSDRQSRSLHHQGRAATAQNVVVVTVAGAMLAAAVAGMAFLTFNVLLALAGATLVM